MSGLHRYLHVALFLTGEYDGTIPLHHYLRNYFRKHKKFGSRDRRWIKELCYAWYRAFFLFRDMSPATQLGASFYLTNDTGSALAEEILASAGHEFNGLDINLPVEDKLRVLKGLFPEIEDKPAFPYGSSCSPVFDVQAFSLALLRKPGVWIRVRPRYQIQAEAALKNAGMAFVKHGEWPYAWCLHPSSKIGETGIVEKGWAEVQDLSSQKTAKAMTAKAGECWYDACAASGGKSLLLMEKEPGVILTVSDNRKSVLDNLDIRFRRNGITSYTSLVLDLAGGGDHDFYRSRFDGIIADVPCSGSGTWTRNPEQMVFFSQEKLKYYLSLQAGITARVAGMLKPGGRLVYITCSVFKEENEDRVSQMVHEHGFSVVSMELIQGSEEGADTLFCANLLKG